MTPAAVLSILVKADGVAAATGELSKLDSTAKKTSKSTDAMAAKSKAGFATISNASKYVAFGVAGIGAAAVKAAGDFQSSMNQLQAVSGTTTRQLNALRKEAIKLGADTKLPATSAQDAAEAMTEMVKAGVSVKDTMGGVRDVLVLSAAAQIGNAKAAEIASNAMNAFHLKGKDVKKITDELANTANASSVEITDVADSFQMAAAVFSGFQGPAIGAKKAMTELNVAIGILGNAGIKGSDAGTSLKQTLLQLTGPSNKAKDAMKALFIAAKDNSASETEVAKALRGTSTERGKALASLVKHNKALGGSADIAYDATGKMRGLKDIIALVTAGTSKMTQEEKNSALTQIFGADATRSIIALMSAGPAAFDKMTASVTKQGAAQELANSKMKGFKGSVEAFKSTMETLAITFGTVLLPALTSVVKQFTGFANVMGAHQKAAMIAIATLGGLATAVIAVNTAVKIWKATTAAMAAVQTALNVVLFDNPIGMVVLALAALAAGVIYAYKHVDAFRKIVDTAWGAIKTGVMAAIDFVKQHWPTIIAILAGPLGVAVLLIVKHFDSIKEAAKKLPGQIADAIKSAPGKILNAGISLGKSIVDGVLSGLGQLGHTILQKFKDAAGWVGGKIGGLFSGIGKIVGIGSGDGIGKSLAGGVLPSGGAFGGSLMGARSSLRPFAAIGSRFGLSVSDGKRPAGTRTASGGISYHSTGEAIDMSDGRGPDSNKLRYFNFLKSHFGGRLAELIYTPGGMGIKDGHPFRYTGQVAADHFDHVHVAFDSGRPGLGDGLGRASALGRFKGDGIGFNGAARLAESVGLPGITFAQIARGESGFNPRAIGHDPGGTTGYGLWQITTKYNDDIIAKYGGPQAMLNAHTNALAARDVWRRQGKSAWNGTKYVTGWNLHYKGAKLIKAAKGKLKHGKSVVRPGHFDPAAGYPDPPDTDASLGMFLGKRAGTIGQGSGMKGVFRPDGTQAGADTGNDPNQPLIDAQNAAAAAAQALKDALDEVKDEMKRQTDFATSVANTSNFQLTKSLADLVSGRIVGYGVAGRAFTPGTGVEVTY